MAAGPGMNPGSPGLRGAAVAFAAAAFFFQCADAAAEAAPRYRPADAERVLIVLPAMTGTGTDLASADLAQQRHEFHRARELLTRVLDAERRHAEARLKRANVNLLLGDFDAAREDCLGVLQAGAALPGTICLASAMTGPGSLERARRLLASLDAAGPAPAEVTRWRLMTEADLALRAGDVDAALGQLARANALDPTNEEARTRFAELLHAKGRDALALEVASPPGATLARLVIGLRAAEAIKDPRAAGYRLKIDELLDVLRRRGEQRHERERAQLALSVEGDAVRALGLALQNFAIQKDTPDLRLLIDAALAAGDRESLRLARAWLTKTGFEDRVADARLREAGA
jgi:tetratricopeptide (TPR) repeat protein